MHGPDCRIIIGRTGWAMALLVALLGSTCQAKTLGNLLGPKGANADEKRAAIRQESEEILAALYAERPDLRATIPQAAGYATFNSLNTHLLLLSGASGYGVVIDSASGTETFMRMAQLGAGVGAGIKDYRIVFVFRTRAVMEEFIHAGLQLGGQADAALKSGEKGRAVELAAGVDSDLAPVQVYQLTEAGIALQATLGGTKYWRDKELNQ